MTSFYSFHFQTKGKPRTEDTHVKSWVQYLEANTRGNTPILEALHFAQTAGKLHITPPSDAGGYFICMYRHMETEALQNYTERLKQMKESAFLFLDKQLGSLL